MVGVGMANFCWRPWQGPFICLLSGLPRLQAQRREERLCWGCCGCWDNTGYDVALIACIIGMAVLAFKYVSWAGTSNYYIFSDSAHPCIGLLIGGLGQMFKGLLHDKKVEWGFWTFIFALSETQSLSVRTSKTIWSPLLALCPGDPQHLLAYWQWFALVHQQGRAVAAFTRPGKVRGD